MLELSEFLDRKPKALSGGQRQRVAMGRAIVREPQVFLMDEPLSNLDTQLRVSTRTQISAMQRRLGITTVYVTHDQVEAMTMGDRVAVLKDGLLQQVDSPLALYERPANLFVARFIGSPGMNLLETRPQDGSVTLGHQRLPLERGACAQSTGGRVTLGIRPEHWRFVQSGQGLEMTISQVEDLGSVSFVYGSVKLDDGSCDLVVRTGSRSGLTSGQVVEIAADPEFVVLFDAGTGERLAA
jgi:multiple sugar transport system ATP-binding protein